LKKKKSKMKFSKKLKKYFEYFINNNFLVFIFFTISIFLVFHNLFNSYFEADEWFHFTHYFPLTRNPFGFLIALVKSIIDTNALSEGQHIVPIGEELFFLNTLIFGLNFKSYVLISLTLHSFNSFLVFLLIKELLVKVKNVQSNLFAVLGGIFFAFTPIPVHVITWAAFYGQNVLSITFFLLSMLFLQKAINKKIKKYLFISSAFLLLDLLTKEIAVVLFFVIPIMILMNRGSFKMKSLTKIYSIPLAFFIPFRFIIPSLYTWANHWVVVNSNLVNQPNKIINDGINFPLIIYRSITFPLSMISQVFIPGATMLSFMKIISPFIYYQYPGEPEARSQNLLFFIYGPGQNLLYYLLSFGIIALVILMLKKHIKRKETTEGKVVFLAFFLIIVSSFPLVFNVLRIPSWGTDFFDSRHYYMPSIGAAILLPFLLVYISELIVKILRKIKIYISTTLVLIILFIFLFINNFSVLQSNFNIIIDQTGIPRQKIISQLKQYLSVLPKKVVFYAETDGRGAYGTVLPFQTSFPQILTVVYYDKNPLPDSFFDKFVLDAKPQGYMYSERRGFGFYNSKKSLKEALLAKSFSVEDIYAFYYNSKTVKLNNITKSIREEMNNYLKNLNDNYEK
jgi:hypothetical protein